MSRAFGLLVVLLAYIPAVAVGWAVTWVIGDALHPIWSVLLADIAATLVIFGASLIARNASFYDPYWSVAPIPIALFFVAWPLDVAADPVRPLLVLALVTIWAVRLTVNWATGWEGLSHVDWRYRMLKEQTGPLYPLVNLMGIQLFPTVLVFLGCLALWPAMRSGTPLGVLDVVAAVVTLGAVALEAVADLQMRAFAANRTDPGAVMDRGVWSWSRHPNYLGEIGFWFGLWVFALATGWQSAWTGVGWAAMLLLFMGISIPMMEKRQRARKPAFEALMSRVPMLFPWPRPRRRPPAQEQVASSASHSKEAPLP